MLNIKLYGKIVDEETRLFYKWATGSDDLAFSSLNLEKTIEDYSGNEITLDIDSPGGFIEIALAAYDILRTSGKSIHTNIVGHCDSAATVLLLAGAEGQRRGNPNLSALIHEVRTPMTGYYTSDELKIRAEDVDAITEKVATIYADRTKVDKAKAMELIKAEKPLTASQMQEYGFINIINNYNTNFKTMDGSNKSILNKLRAYLGTAKTAENSANTSVEFTDNSDRLLFTSAVKELKEGQEINLAEGVTDGVYLLKNEAYVAIEAGKIAAIAQNGTAEHTIIMQAEKIETLEALLKEAEIALLNSEKETKTTGAPVNLRPAFERNRNTQSGKPNTATTGTSRVEELKKNMENFKN